MIKTIVDDGEIVKYEIVGAIKNEELLSKDDLIKKLYEAASIIDSQRKYHLRENICPKIGVDYSDASFWADELRFEDLSDIPDYTTNSVYSYYKNYRKDTERKICKILEQLKEIDVKSNNIYLSIYLDNKHGQVKHYYDTYWREYFKLEPNFKIDYKSEILKQWEQLTKVEYNMVSYRIDDHNSASAQS